MRARFIKQIGVRGNLRIYWDEVVCQSISECPDCPGGHRVDKYVNTCPNAYGSGKPGVHNAYTFLRDDLGSTDFLAFGNIEDYPEEQWPTHCKHCGAPVPANPQKPTAVGLQGVSLHRQVSASRLYDSPSGAPEPGDVYYLDWHDPGECPYWDNCDGKHLWGICPNGASWDIDARASNCTMKEERTHRCWIRSGDPEAGTLHVDKNGHTCAAGAGSIDVPGWHGFLHQFSWNGC